MVRKVVINGRRYSIKTNQTVFSNLMLRLDKIFKALRILFV